MARTWIRCGNRSRVPGPLFVLCDSCSKEHGPDIFREFQGVCMKISRLLGFDILGEKYAYGYDSEIGYTAAEKIPERWVPTTCGYCSVGCGMFIGVRDGKAVSVRGNPDHVVNHGKLCPKGLAEHHTIDVNSRARYPLMRVGGGFQRVSWDEALGEMVDRFRSVQERFGPRSLGVISTGQLVTEE